MNLGKTILSIACAIISTSALADNADIKSSDNQVGVQLTSTNMNYTGTGNGVVGTPGATYATENGNVPGFALSASVMQNLWLGNDYIEAEYSHDNGHTNYTGGTPYGSRAGEAGATLSDYHLRYGKGFAMNNQFMLTPYGEVGSHEWDSSAEGNFTNDYFGAGVLAQYSPINKLVLSGNALVGHTFNGSTTGASGVAGYSALGSSNLYRVGLSADYALSKSLHANAGVDYTSFNYGAGAMGSGVPNSLTDYTTYKVGLGYAF